MDTNYNLIASVHGMCGVTPHISFILYMLWFFLGFAVVKSKEIGTHEILLNAYTKRKWVVTFGLWVLILSGLVCYFYAQHASHEKRMERFASVQFHELEAKITKLESKGGSFLVHLGTEVMEYSPLLSGACRREISEYIKLKEGMSIKIKYYQNDIYELWVRDDIPLNSILSRYGNLLIYVVLLFPLYFFEKIWKHERRAFSSSEFLCANFWVVQVRMIFVLLIGLDLFLKARMNQIVSSLF